MREYIERAVRLGGIINTKNSSEALAALGRKGDETIKFTRQSRGSVPGFGLLATTLAGQLAPQPILSSGIRLDRAVGYEFALLATPAFASSLSARLKTVASDAGVRIVDDAAPSLQSWLADCNVETVLVRPDRYVLGTASNEHELLALLRLHPSAGRCSALSRRPTLNASIGALRLDKVRGRPSYSFIETSFRL